MTESPARVLVTGAAGVIGRSLVRRLRGEGQPVRAMLRPGTTPPGEWGPGVEVVEADIRDPAAVGAAMNGVEIVHHLAAVTVPPEGKVSELMDINVEGTAVVARAALDQGIKRFVFTSSSALYGRRIANRHITEDTPPRPDSPYSISKVRAEEVVLKLHREEGLPAVINRPCNVFGPETKDWREMFQLIESGNFRFIGKGEGLRDLTDVDDFCDGLMLCASVPGIEGRIYNLVGREPMSLHDWVMKICEETGSTVKTPAIPAWPARIYNAFNNVALSAIGRELPLADRLNLFLGDRAHSNDRAQNELGYSPRSSARQIIEKTIAGYRDRGWLSKPAVSVSLDQPA